jgi:hypothetical protein
MGFLDGMRLAAEQARQQNGQPWDAHQSSMPWVTKLRMIAEQARQQRAAHPWEAPIGRLKGKISSDGIERISTQLVFDYLDVPQCERAAVACSTLSKLMQAQGWSPVRFRGITRGGFLDQVRGYAREAARSSPARSP